jgi:hypothetical protein
VSYTDDLGRELSAVGITGGLRERIVTEFADHLESDPKASLGEPAELAREFADEHGSIRARRAVLAGFAALVLAAAVVAVGVATGRSLGFPVHKHPYSSTLAAIGATLTVIGGQVAFAAGMLAALRVLNRRRIVLNRAEAVVLSRRVSVALASALVAMVGLAIVGIEYHHVVAGSWPTVALVGACVGAAGLLAATPWVLAASRLRPVGSGAPGDIFDDLGPLAPSPLVDRPWALPLIVAAAIVVAVTAGGVIQSDPFDGAARGILDGLACLAGFGLLGRYLGLRAPAGSG